MSIRVLVCGGRDYRSWLRVDRVLYDVRAKHGIACIIHGGARGADRLADLWAIGEGIDIDCYPADWERDGRAAGPLRNARMLAEGKPDLVIAFPGGKGTADMVRQAKAAGVDVIEVSR